MVQAVSRTHNPRWHPKSRSRLSRAARGHGPRGFSFVHTPAVAKSPVAPTSGERFQLLLTAVVALVPFALLAVWAHVGSQAIWEQGLLTALLAPSGLTGMIS